MDLDEQYLLPLPRHEKFGVNKSCSLGFCLITYSAMYMCFGFIQCAFYKYLNTYFIDVYS